MGNASQKGKPYDPADGIDDWKGDKVDGSLESRDAEEASKQPIVDVYTVSVRMVPSSLLVALFCSV